ncbi:MAG: hypothetical protein HYX91_03575 [Chloroflexi bacterium]|nr:hypothetical protein [Chloroflexota bacterium]
MEDMLVLLDRPEDIEGRLEEIQQVAASHKVKRVYLARAPRAFGTRVRGMVAPHKLKLAVQMSAEATGIYLSRAARELSKGGLNVEVISASQEEIDRLMGKSNIDLLIGVKGIAGSPACEGRLQAQTSTRAVPRREA